MNETKSCAPADLWTAWEQIQWNKCEHEVRKLQARIVKAQKEGRHNKVKALQWMLTHSFYGKALAIKRVTSNAGKNTTGVDHVRWDTPRKKMDAIADLKRRGYRPHPLRRVNIEKSNGKLRPLGIPTLKDRAMQRCTIWHLTLWRKLRRIHIHMASEKNGAQRMQRKCASRYYPAKLLRNGYWRVI